METCKNHGAFSNLDKKKMNSEILDVVTKDLDEKGFFNGLKLPDTGEEKTEERTFEYEDNKLLISDKFEESYLL